MPEVELPPADESSSRRRERSGLLLAAGGMGWFWKRVVAVAEDRRERIRSLRGWVEGREPCAT